MSETEKKGSAWPWIAVPVAAVLLFFGLRYCQKHMPQPEQQPATTVPATPEPSSPKPGEPAPAGEQPEPAQAPATGAEPAPTPR